MSDGKANAANSKWVRGFAAARRVPFGPLILMVLFLATVKEFYPFSDFPMYSSFDETATVVYVTDGQDRIIAMRDIFGHGTSSTKKAFKRELTVAAGKHGRKLEEGTPEDYREAGEAMLHYLVGRRREKPFAALNPDELRFYHLKISFRMDTFREEHRHIATLGPPWDS